jgi:hypothetical protein
MPGGAADEATEGAVVVPGTASTDGGSVLGRGGVAVAESRGGGRDAGPVGGVEASSSCGPLPAMLGDEDACPLLVADFGGTRLVGEDD